MSLDFYPAYLKTNDDETGAKFWENAVPMEGDSERLCEAARTNPDFEGKVYEPNPNYIPFSSLNMANGNAYGILKMIGVDPGDEGFGAAPIQEVFRKAHHYLSNNYRDVEIYVVERVFALREMARLGISRGCTHIVWA